MTDRPVVADPEYTEVNQAYLQYKHGEFTGVLGCQRITLDNQRFIGNVGWRQKEQTYDALTFRSTALAKTTLQICSSPTSIASPVRTKVRNLPTTTAPCMH